MPRRVALGDQAAGAERLVVGVGGDDDHPSYAVEVERPVVGTQGVRTRPAAGVPGPWALNRGASRVTTSASPRVVAEHLLALAGEVALGVVLAEVDGEVGDASGVVLVAGQRRRAERVADALQDLLGRVGDDLARALGDEHGLAGLGGRASSATAAASASTARGAGERGVDGAEVERARPGRARAARRRRGACARGRPRRRTRSRRRRRRPRRSRGG